MRINKFLALTTGMSRRAADKAIEQGEAEVNGQTAKLGQEISESDEVMHQGRKLQAVSYQLIMLNKPTGVVVSRDGQGSKTIYDLLPPELHNLKPVGRLDKDSSGLLLLTNDGNLANELTHPKHHKEKVYEVAIDCPLAQKDFELITNTGVDIGDSRLSLLRLQQLEISNQKTAKQRLLPNSYFLVTIHEGRNRQIRRTFATLGYEVTKLHRTRFGPYTLNRITPGNFKNL